MKQNEYYLLKSKDDLSLLHGKNTPLYKQTGFSGTAGEAIKDYKGNITLFVDPRYHIQADFETKGKNIKVMKLDMKTNFIKALKTFLKAGDTLYIPSKSTPLYVEGLLKKELENVKILPYETEDEPLKNCTVVEIGTEITGKTPEEKINALRKKLNGKCLFLSNLDEVSYLLNLRSFDIKDTSAAPVKILITKKEVYAFSNAKLPTKSAKVLPFKEMAPLISKIKDEILIDENSITLYDYNIIKKPAALKKNPVAKMAAVKNSKELKHFKENFKRLDDALYSFREKIEEGKSEFELKEIFEKELKRFGALGTSFKTILAIGENSSSIHYSNYDKNKFIKKNDILLIDCGGYYEGGYATDITRVFTCKGAKKFSLKVKKIYTAVLKAQLNAFFKDFEDGKGLDACARKILKPYEKEGFLFPHSLGHGVGIPVHQAPPVITSNPKYNSKILDKMVFTIEPGLYKEGEFGVRLENTVYFDKKKGKKITLSKFPYEENLIDFEMLTKKEQKWLQTWQKGAQNE